MAKQGMAGQALSAAYFASLLGGLIGASGLALVIPLARPIVNFFGSPEFFMMALLGIAIVGIVSSGALVKGLLAGAFGLSLGLVGFDSIAGIPRGTLGIDYLWDGLPLIPAIIGLFAIPELLDMVVSDTPIARRRMDDLLAGVNTGRLEGIRLVLRHKLLVLRSSLVGLLVGIMPGVGGSTAHWLAYAQARQSERDAYKTFGTGDIRGVIAPESANNSIDGGVLIPTLTFGLPGSAGMAIMLGFLVLLVSSPGRRCWGRTSTSRYSSPYAWRSPTSSNARCPFLHPSARKDIDSTAECAGAVSGCDAHPFGISGPRFRGRSPCCRGFRWHRLVHEALRLAPPSHRHCPGPGRTDGEVPLALCQHLRLVHVGPPPGTRPVGHHHCVGLLDA